VQIDVTLSRADLVVGLVSKRAAWRFDSFLRYRFSLQKRRFEVDPTRLELVTSAMRRLSVLPDAIVKPFPTNVNSEPTIVELSGTLTE
jgi:hypothetical protein